jgi:hypothetical protein
MDMGCKGCDFKAYCFARRPVGRWEQFMSKSDPGNRLRSGLYNEAA